MYQSDAKCLADFGKGAYSSVKCYKDFYGNLFAIKSYNREKSSFRSGRIFAEKEVLNKLSSPFIIKLFETFKDEDSLYFKFEAVLGGPLHRHIELSHRDNFNLHTIVGITAELASAIYHMGTNGCVHRDIKLNNCLVDVNGHIKLCDLGSSKVLFELEDCSGPYSPRKSYDFCPKTKTYIGTHSYLAPEIYFHKEYSLPVDWWSLGILILEMISGLRIDVTRFFETTDEQKSELLHNEAKQHVDTLGQEVDSSIQMFISHHEQLALNEYQHCKDLVIELLLFNPKNRIGFWNFDIFMNHKFFNGLNWEAVHLGTIEPPFSHYDRRLGYTDFLEQKSEDDPLISDTDQLLFKDF